MAAFSPLRSPMSIQHDIQNTNIDVRVRESRPAKTGSLPEVIAICLAWPLGLVRFVQGMMAEQSVAALEGLIVFFIVYLYTLVRLYQLRRPD
jgi:hypothetical protein